MPDNMPLNGLSKQEQWDWFEDHMTHELWKRLYNEAYRILQNKSDAEDALQEGLRIGITHLSNLRSEKSFNSWMFKIVHYEALHIYKREVKKMDVLSRLMHIKDYFHASSTPENLLITKEESERLLQEIDRLKSPDKEILLLNLTTDKSLRDIADELDVNYHTARSKYTRTLTLLEKRLTMEGDDGSDEKK